MPLSLSPRRGTLRFTNPRDSDLPDKSVNLSPSPPGSVDRPSPAVSIALRLFRAHQKGALDALWISVWLPPEEHIELQNQLKGDEGLWGYVKDKVRYDYDPENSQLIIRMTTPTHDLFIAKVVKEIESQLEAISSSPDQSIAEAAKKIEWQGTSRILLSDDPTDDSKYPKRSPDAAFRHTAAIFPGVVIEVSYTQKRKDLAYIAESYIIGSRGSIRAVVGLDIEYRKTKEATVSVWRPRIGTDDDGEYFLEVEQTVKSEPFRNEDGSPVQANSLALSLRDFAPPEVCPSLADTCPRIELAYSKLADILVGAVDAHRFVEHRLGISRTLPPRTRLKKRQRTPPEQLAPTDEASWQAAEAVAEARVDAEDEEWGRAIRRKV